MRVDIRLREIDERSMRLSIGGELICDVIDGRFRCCRSAKSESLSKTESISKNELMSISLIEVMSLKRRMDRIVDVAEIELSMLLVDFDCKIVGIVDTVSGFVDR